MKQETPTFLIDLIRGQLNVMSILNCRMLCHFAFVELQRKTKCLELVFQLHIET